MGDRSILEGNLSQLLGFEDGVSDVVDYLLSIESSEELLDYLSQLLGSRAPPIQKFVDDAARFKRGEAIQSTRPAESSSSDPRNSQAEESKPPALQRAKVTNSLGSVPRVAKPKIANGTGPRPKAKKPMEATVTVKGSASKQKAPPAARSAVSSAKEPPATEPSSTPATAPLPPSSHKRAGPPQRGKAPLDCGCYGCLHKPLTNCLYCGRVACEKEGYNFCPFCGYLVEKVQRPDGADVDAAWLHKERLLQYDRDLASRTTIIDDQSDYYSKDSVWLSEVERAAAEQQEQERQEELLRKRLHLNLSL